MKALLAGLGVGAAAAILLAPRKGKETRKMLVNRASSITATLKEKRHEVMENAKSSSQNVLEKVKAKGPASVAKLGSDSKAIAEVLNSADRHELMSVNGIGKTTATRIMKHRPYSSAEEVLEEGVLPEDTMEHLKEELLDKKRDTA